MAKDGFNILHELRVLSDFQDLKNSLEYTHRIVFALSPDHILHGIFIENIISIKDSSKHGKRRAHRKRNQASDGKQGDTLVPCDISSANITERPSYKSS